MRVVLSVVLMAEWSFVLVFGLQEIFCMIGKPGTCPRSMWKLPSNSLCSCDTECPGRMKCCGFNSIRYCGRRGLGNPDPCHLIMEGDRICTTNTDCPKGWKCYSNGCGRVCAYPAIVLPHPFDPPILP